MYNKLFRLILSLSTIILLSSCASATAPIDHQTFLRNWASSESVALAQYRDAPDENAIRWATVGVLFGGALGAAAMAELMAENNNPEFMLEITQKALTASFTDSNILYKESPSISGRYMSKRARAVFRNRNPNISVALYVTSKLEFVKDKAVLSTLFLLSDNNGRIGKEIHTKASQPITYDTRYKDAKALRELLYKLQLKNTDELVRVFHEYSAEVKQKGLSQLARL